MKAHEALIAWSGWDDHSPTVGQIAVGRLLDDGQVEWIYATTNGAAFDAQRLMRGAHSTVGLFKDFHFLVVDERLDPEAVHHALLNIDEYAELFG